MGGPSLRDPQPIDGELPIFLRTLDAFVRSDSALPGIKGRICVVVRTASKDVVWSAVFSDVARTAIVDALPPDTSAVLLIGEAESEAMIKKGKEGAHGSAVPQMDQMGLLRSAGNRELLERFVERYCVFRSWVDARNSRNSDRSRERRRSRG